MQISNSYRHTNMQVLNSYNMIKNMNKHENCNNTNKTQDLLNKEKILSCLHTKYMGREIYHYEVTDSTNERAKEHFKENASHGTLVVADSQTGGKGRRGREWASPKGEAVYMSLLLKPDFSPEYASMLTLVMALSLVKSLEQVYESKEHLIQIKWPNDLIWNKKKIAGILTEMSADMNSIHYVIVGVGINLNNTGFSKDLQEKATSLQAETGLYKDRAEVIAKTLELFEKDYEVFCQTFDMKNLKVEYEKYLVNKDVTVRVLDPKGEYTGIARGINDKGELLVEKDGEILPVYAGEVSVRGIYGYV